MSPRETRLTIVLLMALMVSPWIAGMVGVRPSTAENRPLAHFPTLTVDRLLDEDMYASLDLFVVDHTPLRREVASVTNSLLIVATGGSPVSNVFVGVDQTLFLSEDFVQPCSHDYDYEALDVQLSEWESLGPDGGRELLFVVAPDKSAALIGRLDVRSRVANDCQQRRQAEYDDAMLAGDNGLDLRGRLRSSAQTNSDGHTYYRYDSHWTYWGASLYAEALVERFGEGQFDRDEIVEGAEYEVQADIARRLGWDRRESRPRLSVQRSGVATNLDESDINGTRTVRTYASTSDGTSALIPGRTLVVHDSMNNFAEAMIAPHFELIEFVHWNDLDAGEFWRRISDADRIVIETVERQSHVRIAQTILSERFRGLMTGGLSATPAGRLRTDVEAKVDAILAHRATGQIDVGAVAGFGPIDHPTLGTWQLLRIDGTEDSWLRLDGVPPQLLSAFEQLIGTEPIEQVHGVAIDLAAGTLAVRVTIA